ncbi:hypothetical protein TNCV_868141 [Trichonephila clavipes]|nr:hypothetical protein TNCV_868141 [Trichonephila clavipes]
MVPSRHEGTLNSRRAASPLVRLVEGDERWEAPDPPPRFSLSKLEWNRAKSYCHLPGLHQDGSHLELRSVMTLADPEGICSFPPFP